MNHNVGVMYLAKKLNIKHKDLCTMIYQNSKLKPFFTPYNFDVGYKRKTSYLYCKHDEDFIIAMIENIKNGGFIFGNDNI